ncbi:MAG TPA: cytochrome c biogenesis protein CcdA [Bacteroidales bacterium]|nr:cytochrome c biogenesis protein CcdA [Bacteroidales bacterium]
MVKRAFLFVIALIPGILASSQIYDPVNWDFGYTKTNGNEYELIFTATIEKGSHIYSMDIPEGGPIPTSFSIDSSALFTTLGKTYEATKAEEVFDEAFGMKISSFSNSAEFRQKIVSDKKSFTVTGVVNYMACNNVTCSPPKDLEFEIKIGDKETEKTISADTSAPGQKGRGLLSFFLISLLAGFAGVLTPCVFPMIPMTVAFFSRNSEDRGKAITKAIIFGISIILIYSSLGIIVSATNAGAGIASALSTHWIPNTVFFLLFVLFAVSFLGAFEIVLPNSWVTGADARVDRGGVLSSFFLGLTTVIVSFSCTGPIIGALLVEAASGDVLRPTIGMLGFGVAFALPFTVFALFPSIMKRIPKSGGWLNSVKVVLGFIMLAFSMKFLSTIDSVYGFNILSRDLFIAIWIVLFTLMGLYLLGKLKFAHDSDLPYISVFRFFLIIAVFSFVVYLVPGLFGSPLKGITTFLPSGGSELNIPKLMNERKQEISSTDVSTFVFGDQCDNPKYGDFLEMPLGLTGYFDYEQGLECAKKTGKPVLLDFKGHACANCKLMEAKVWSDPVILKKLRDEFVIIALYLDDRTELPESEWITSSIDGKVKKTMGKINEDLEISRFRTNAMPLYVIVDHEGNQLNDPMPTNLNVREYGSWLDDGIARFGKPGKD